MTARRLWTAYTRLARDDARVRWVSIAAVVIVAAAAVVAPMLIIVLAIALAGTYAVLRSPLCTDLFVGKDVDDWA